MESNPYILFIPGIKGSELWEGDNKRWFPKNLEDLQSLNINNFMEARSPLNVVNGFNIKRKKIYKGIIEGFTSEEAELFSYDWRVNIIQSAELLVSEINRLSAKYENLHLVAHSMGGMIAKIAILQLKEYGLSDKVKKLITIGTPWHGAPDSYKALSFGEPGFFEDLSNLFEAFNDKKTRALARQLPSVFQLLPSRHYFDDNDDEGKFLFPNEEGGIVSYADVQMRAQNFYNEMVSTHGIPANVWDEFMSPVQKMMLQELPDHIEHDNLIGCQEPTLYRLPIESTKKRLPFKNDCKFENGDGVVPVFSATPSHAANLYYCSAQHSTMCSENSIIQFIKWSLGGKEYPIPQGVYEEEIRDLFKQGVWAKIMCPVDSTIVDSENRYVAGVFDPNIEEISPHALDDSVTYFSIGEAKYVYFNEDVKEDMIIKINSYDNGVADISVKTYNENSLQEEKFDPLPVSDETAAVLRIPLSNRNHETSLHVESKVIEPKVTRRSKQEVISEIKDALPRITIRIDNQGNKVKYRKIYSGKITLVLDVDDINNVENLFYAIDGGIPQKYTEPVNLNLESGTHIIKAFGKDKFNRSLKMINLSFKVDEQKPLTKIFVDIDPEGMDLSFKPVTNGAGADSYFRINSDDLFEKFDSTAKINLGLAELRSNPNSYYKIDYYSVNEFGNEGDIQSINLGLGNIPVLMWEENSSMTQPLMIWDNMLKHEKLNLYEAEIILIGKGNKISRKVTPNQDIPDNIRSVKFVLNLYEFDVRFLEKYSLYFDGAPTEVLEVGETHEFSFKLISERTHDTITHTRPRARLVAIKTKKVPDRQISLTEDDEGIFKGAFEVDEQFLEYRYKLVITDLKNVKPPLREIPLIMKDEDEDDN
ncbi:hypothetical protein QF049_001087 [Paenibacillus sp. W4I10]|uniref:lipase family alpha/beta hydrolase n=1 Tax=Paenibacillus sp. W4I10 TaxID=3042298 RepID=UPI0027837F56|nr:alpha/beta fold hydrolase [Paenibacillus sp. W4I10]MDQ0719826.1 hypothetical protein [Paenibacillus sp. W4I10]